MINILDRIVQYPGRFHVTEVSEGVIDLTPVPGTVTEAGTDANRVLFMALQGFHGNTTVFNADGSITETNSAGHTKTTTFVSDSVITEVFTDGTHTITKTTTFNADGSISEVIS